MLLFTIKAYYIQQEQKLTGLAAANPVSYFIVCLRPLLH